MHTVSFWQIKGGSGKSTLSAQVGAMLAAQGQRVLLLDVDGQQTLSKSLCPPNTKAPTLLDVMNNRASLEAATITVRYNLDCVIADESFLYIEEELAYRQREYTLFSDILAQASENYDICLMDLHAGIGLLVRSALRASDSYIMPIYSDFASISSAQLSERQLARTAIQTELAGIILNFYQDRTVAQSVARQAEKMWPGRVFASRIAAREVLKQMSPLGRTVTDEPDDSIVRVEFAQLANEVLTYVEHSHNGATGK